MSIGVGGSSGNSQSQTALDPEIKGDWQSLFDRAKSTADLPAPAQQVAGLNSQQLTAGSQLANAPYVGAGAIQEGIGRADDITKNIPQVNPAMMTAASIDPGSIYKVGTADVPGIQNKDGYFNLFDDNVTKPILDGIDYSRRQQLAQNTSTATGQGGEGAWNGSRAGVSDALTNEAAQRQAAQAVAGIELPKFQTATSLMEQDQGRLSGEQTTNAGNWLNAALTNVNNQQSADAVNAAAKNAAQAHNQDAFISGQQQELGSAALLGQLGQQQQGQYITGQQAAFAGGQTQQQAAQAALDAQYGNEMTARNLPIQTIESAFGILPTTSSGGSSVNHSSGKSGNAGF